jgi:hypothetical protein
MSENQKSRFPQHEIDLTPAYTKLGEERKAQEAAQAAEKAATDKAAADAEAAKKAAEGAK